MGSGIEPVWDVRSQSGLLIAYAKRAKDAGWFVRISGLNDNPKSEKLYIGDDVFPPDFMKTMLEMHKDKDAQPWKL
jgi:hypothetical protein